MHSGQSLGLRGLVFWLRDHPLICVGSFLLLGVIAWRFMLGNDSEWEDVYMRAARQMRNAGDLYHGNNGGYLYPPFMAWAAIPFSYLPMFASRAAWLTINLGCLVLVFRWSWRLADGGSITRREDSFGREQFAAVTGALGGLVYMQNCIAHRQTDVVAATLLIGGCMALRGARPMSAATCLGLAAAMKCTALLWAPYLVWRGRPRAAAWLVAVAFAVNLAPDLTYRAPYNHPWLVEYGVHCLKPLTASDHYAGVWASEIIYNQSVAGTLSRWFLTDWNWTPTHCRVETHPSPVSPAMVNGSVRLVQFVLVLGVLLTCRRAFRPVEDESDGALRAPLEYSVVLLLMLLLSPMSGKAHFGTLLLPSFLLARLAMHRSGWLLKTTVLGATFIAVIGNKDIIGTRLYTLAMWHGSVTLHTLFLLFGCLVLLGGGGLMARTNEAAPVGVNRAA